MSDLFAIEGKHVLVTGASSGFGRLCPLSGRARRTGNRRGASRRGDR